MKDLLNNGAFLSLLGALFGGAGLKLIENWLGKAKEKNDAGAALRSELRIEIEGLRKQTAAAAVENQRLDLELERWKGLYYDLREDRERVITELTITKERLLALQAKYAEALERQSVESEPKK